MAERNYTRQLATIISIDAVGFSRLMGIDDELAVAAFEERRDIIAGSCGAFGGRTLAMPATASWPNSAIRSRHCGPPSTSRRGSQR
ncbi:hypothetical protein ACVOMV_36720 [Mesorhizobium atlanticum]